MRGALNVDVHYYEDGNVQLKTKSEKKAQVNINDPAGIIKEIRKAEQVRFVLCSHLECVLFLGF